MKQRSTLKAAMMATVAAVAVAGFTTIAAAQTPQSPSTGGASAPGAAQSGTVEKKGGMGGAMKYQQNSAQPGEKSSGEKSSGMSGQSAQEGAKPGQRPEQNSAQDEKTPNGMNPQKGAETEHNTQLKGAQEERNERGAQTESGKAGVNATQQNAQGSVRGGATSGATSHGASVQLSQDQRSRIGTIIGRGSSARLTSKPDFNITVGATVPKSVHVVTLPPDVVEVVPQYRGYDYIVVSDQILIIDPDTMEIVAVIET